jgi:hypothetical protein
VTTDVQLLPLDATTLAPGNPAAIGQHDLLFPIVGNWSARISAAGDESLVDGPATLVFGGSTFRGYLQRAESDRGQYSGVITGGTARLPTHGLHQLAKAQHFLNTPPRAILSQTLQAVGETLATDSTGLDAPLNYPRRAIRVDRVLDELADALGLIWRVRPSDGAVWFGRDNWPASGTKFTYLKKQPDLLVAEVMLAPFQEAILPGQTVVLDSSAGATAIDKTAQRVTVAHYFGDADHGLCKLWLADPRAVSIDPLAPDRLHSMLAEIARASVRGVDWYRAFQGIVELRRSDDSLDVTLDQVFGKPEMPPVRAATVSVPVGGAARRVNVGERCTVIFEGGDYRRPRVVCFESGAATRGVALLDSTGIAGTLLLNVVAGVLSGTYTAPNGATTVIANGVTVSLQTKITGNVSADLKLP